MRSPRNSMARPIAVAGALLAVAIGVTACNSNSSGPSAGGAYGNGYGASSSSGAMSSASSSSGAGTSGYGSSGSGSSGQYGNGSSGSGSSGSGMASASKKGGLMKAELTAVGKLLANPHGMTVYYYSEDKPGSGVSACTSACATAWPPVLAPVRFPASVKQPGPLGVIIRPGGIRQLTINGFPIYRYAGDKMPGQATGNGLEGEWHVIKI